MMHRHKECSEGKKIEFDVRQSSDASLSNLTLNFMCPQCYRQVPHILQIMRCMAQGKIASWWMPDHVVTVEEIPMTATGKISKKDLREQLKDMITLTSKL